MSSRSGSLSLIALVFLAGVVVGLFVLYRSGGSGRSTASEHIVTCQVVRGPFDHVLVVEGAIESSVNIDIACQVKAISSSGQGGSGVPASRAAGISTSTGAGAGASKSASASKAAGGASSSKAKAAGPSRTPTPSRVATPNRAATPSRAVTGNSGGGGGGFSGGGSNTGTPILWVIEEGTRVNKGDKLVELDSAALQQQLATQRIAVSNAKAQLISSEASVRTAEIALQEYLEGTYQSERKAILAEIDLDKQQLLTSELKLETAQSLEEKGLLQPTQVQAETFSKTNAQDMLSSAEARLDILDRLTKQKYQVQFESNIEAARARRESDARVLAEQEGLQSELLDQIAKCIMLSPADGIVVYNNEYSGRGEAEFVVAAGTLVRERKVIIKLPDLTKMQVVTSINEQNVALVAEGMAAKIKIRALEKEMLGRVTKVNRYADPASFFSSSVKKYSLFVEILNPPEGLQTGMTAETRIFTKQIPDAIQIPVHALHEQDGRHFCLRKIPEGWETQEVEVGVTNDSFVTLKSGLAEGDTVALDPSSHIGLLQMPAKKELTNPQQAASMTTSPEPS